MDAPLPPTLPPAPLNAAEVQAIKDVEHLRLLHYAYYIVGGFTALFSSFGLIHFFIGVAALSGAFPPLPPPPPRPPHHAVQPAAEAPADPTFAAETPAPSTRPFSPDDPVHGPAARPAPPDNDDRREPPDFPFPSRVFGLLFMVLGGTVVLLGWTIGGLTAYAGRCLRDRKHRVFTMIMAGVNCLHIPFGTMLGVFTFVVLGRPSVQALYLHPVSPRQTPPRV